MTNKILRNVFHNLLLFFLFQCVQQYLPNYQILKLFKNKINFNEKKTRIFLILLITIILHLHSNSHESKENLAYLLHDNHALFYDFSIQHHWQNNLHINQCLCIQHKIFLYVLLFLYHSYHNEFYLMDNIHSIYLKFKRRFTFYIK